MQIWKNYSNTACLMQLKLPQLVRLLIWCLIRNKESPFLLVVDTGLQAENYNEGYVAAQVMKKHGWLTY